MSLLDFIGLKLNCAQSHFMLVPQDCPVEGPNTVFSNSFLLTFPMAFLGIADRILKIGFSAWHIQNIATWLLLGPDSWEACLQPSPWPRPPPSQGCLVSAPALQPPAKLCEGWSSFFLLNSHVDLLTPGWIFHSHNCCIRDVWMGQQHLFFSKMTVWLL